jgi:hypothetical protein
MKHVKEFESVIEGKWFISYGLGGGFGGANNFKVIDAENDEEASKYAWEMACQDYENYAGYHGLRNVDEIMEEDEVDEEAAEEVYIEERESWLDYSAEPYDPEKHDAYLN